MTPEQLRIFLAVAERGHVTRAAGFLGISQSAASAAIKALELSSGVQLFNRVGRAIELSAAGRRFLPEAKAVLERIAAARHVPLDLPARDFALISHRDRHPAMAQTALKSFLLAGTTAID